MVRHEIGCSGPESGRTGGQLPGSIGRSINQSTEMSGEHQPSAGGTAQYRTGTTIVAATATDGVVLAADNRMSLGGGFTASKDVQKVEQVHPTAAMAIAGHVGPAQQLLRSLRAESRLYDARRGEPMSLGALARAAGTLVRGMPVHPLLGGVDETGGHVYELDGSGSVIEDSYAASGSGMQPAYGVLDDRIDPGEPVASVKRAAAGAVRAASERDNASGNGVTLATVTGEGVEIERRAS